jgi:hypothetical protein
MAFSKKGALPCDFGRFGTRAALFDAIPVRKLPIGERYVPNAPRFHAIGVDYSRFDHAGGGSFDIVTRAQIFGRVSAQFEGVSGHRAPTSA